MTQRQWVEQIERMMAFVIRHACHEKDQRRMEMSNEKQESHPLDGVVVTASMVNEAGWPETVYAGNRIDPRVYDFLRRRFDEGWRPEGWPDVQKS